MSSVTLLRTTVRFESGQPVATIGVHCLGHHYLHRPQNIALTSGPLMLPVNAASSDVDECLLGLHSCMPGEQFCYNQKGSYSCVNSDGSLTVPWVHPNPGTLSPVSRGPLAVNLNGLEREFAGRTGPYFANSSGRCPTGYTYNDASRVCDGKQRP